eukprot:gnl/TRDRNA2_/TRDRNA2_129943_c0_seq4.p1 gnl/TRDRNA2_/TRDRNA2_129943_c0~~gnl/TRDRNA2_/TRDRNA2_129943_c0_seq4.p1  ORF type:complete len:455 (+),score=47.79 gnl/TRDRNA2_/TRDRNA2_129943_c0_seq4:73-1437(+)
MMSDNMMSNNMMGANTTAKLFLGGLSPGTTSDMIGNYFSQCCGVNVVEATAMYNEQGQHRGFGFVTLDSQAAADQVTGYPHQIDGRVISVSPCLAQGLAPPASGKAAVAAAAGLYDPARYKPKLFIGGISPATTAEMIAEYFAQYGKVVHAEHMMTPGGRTRGFGFVTFENSEAADNCLAYPHYLDGRLVNLKAATKEGTKWGEGGTMTQSTAMLRQPEETRQQIETMLDEWVEAKRGKNFAVADRIRNELRAKGIEPEVERPAGSGGQSSKGFGAKISDKEIASMLDGWEAAKYNKDFATADKIRTELRGHGVEPDKERPQAGKGGGIGGAKAAGRGVWDASKQPEPGPSGLEGVDNSTLLDGWVEAKCLKDFATADWIRDELRIRGIHPEMERPDAAQMVPAGQGLGPEGNQGLMRSGAPVPVIPVDPAALTKAAAPAKGGGKGKGKFGMPY